MVSSQSSEDISDHVMLSTITGDIIESLTVNWRGRILFCISPMEGEGRRGEIKPEMFPCSFCNRIAAEWDLFGVANAEKLLTK